VRLSRPGDAPGGISRTRDNHVTPGSMRTSSTETSIDTAGGTTDDT